jgi:hypothetical protein
MISNQIVGGRAESADRRAEMYAPLHARLAAKNLGEQAAGGRCKIDLQNLALIWVDWKRGHYQRALRPQDVENQSQDLRGFRI